MGSALEQDTVDIGGIGACVRNVTRGGQSHYIIYTGRQGGRSWEEPSPKSLDLNKNFEPIRYIVAILSFVAIQALFGNSLSKKVIF